MKKIYVSHSTNFDYKKELYTPLKKLEGVEMVFPHEGSKIRKSKDIIKGCSFLIAEVSYHSHGVGVEIGWADSSGIPIVFIFKRGMKVSSSLNIVSNRFIQYKKIQEILPQLEKMLDF